MQALLNSPKPSTNLNIPKPFTNLYSLRQFHDTIENHIRDLFALRKSEDRLGFY